MSEYKDDILYLLKTKKYNDTKNILELKLAKIESMHTQEFKDNAEVDSIINGLL